MGVTLQIYSVLVLMGVVVMVVVMLLVMVVVWVVVVASITQSLSRYTPCHTIAYSEACFSPLCWTTDTRAHVKQGTRTNITRTIVTGNDISEVGLRMFVDA